MKFGMSGLFPRQNITIEVGYIAVKIISGSLALGTATAPPN